MRCRLMENLHLASFLLHLLLISPKNPKFAQDMRKRDKTCAKATPLEPKREQRIVCLMSDEELRIVDRYLAKYKITNKSRWFRETILGFIHKKMEDDYPTLFGEHDMRR